MEASGGTPARGPEKTARDMQRELRLWREAHSARREAAVPRGGRRADRENAPPTGSAGRRAAQLKAWHAVSQDPQRTPCAHRALTNAVSPLAEIQGRSPPEADERGGEARPSVVGEVLTAWEEQAGLPRAPPGSPEAPAERWDWPLRRDPCGLPPELQRRALAAALWAALRPEAATAAAQQVPAPMAPASPLLSSSPQDGARTEASPPVAQRLLLRLEGSEGQEQPAAGALSALAPLAAAGGRTRGPAADARPCPPGGAESSRGDPPSPEAGDVRGQIERSAGDVGDENWSAEDQEAAAWEVEEGHPDDVLGQIKRHSLFWPRPTLLDMEDHLSRAPDIATFWFFELRDRASGAVSDSELKREVLDCIPEYPPDWPQWRRRSLALREAAREDRRRAASPRGGGGGGGGPLRQPGGDGAAGAPSAGL